MGTYTAKKAIAEFKQRAEYIPSQWRCPKAQAGGSPAPQGGIQAGYPASISEAGVQRGLHLLEREPECICVEFTVADVHEKQMILYGMPAQELDFARTQRAFTVKVQRQWPIHFPVHGRHSCITIVQDMLKETG